ncbi:DUF357 domain-containing protein [bacterium]|nr:DUF357 domain-containing protein [bacterium]
MQDKIAIQDKISSEKLDKYFKITGDALKKIKISPPEKTHLEKMALDFLDMAQRYYEDAKHFSKNGEIVTAFAALNYAHGWLDAGARAGLFDVEHDNVLFTVD